MTDNNELENPDADNLSPRIPSDAPALDAQLPKTASDILAEQPEHRGAHARPIESESQLSLEADIIPSAETAELPISAEVTEEIDATDPETAAEEVKPVESNNEIENVELDHSADTISNDSDAAEEVEAQVSDNDAAEEAEAEASEDLAEETDDDADSEPAEMAEDLSEDDLSSDENDGLEADEDAVGEDYPTDANEDEFDEDDFRRDDLESLENIEEEVLDAPPYMQNRELSWLTFNERVLDQGADETVPLLARLNFISIFWSNLQEFFMVRVGSLTDLSYVEPPLHDSKTNMTPHQQIKAIHDRCHELYPIQERIYERVRGNLAREGVKHLRPNDLLPEQREFLVDYMHNNIEPFLSPQIINARHPFPHLENGKLYIVVRLDEELAKPAKSDSKKKKKAKKAKEQGADGVIMGLIPLPHQCERIVELPGKGFQFILLEHVIEMFAQDVFSMYNIKHVNVICVTRNADLDSARTNDGDDEDYREHMKRFLRLRKRLAPVRLECEAPLSPVMSKLLLQRLNLEPYQVYDTTVPLDLSFTWGLGDYLSDKKRARLADPAFTPQWPVSFDHNRPIIDQVSERETLLMYPYESMDPFVQLLREAANDPSVISIKITLYRLARQSHLAEALIAAAENGKEVTALFELRARFDEANNIEWSQRFEQAGCNVIYGFEYYKVHSKICCITRQTPDGIQYITQLGTGNYNEKTAKLYTDISFITTDKAFGRDAVEFFRNMSLENISDNYDIIQVAPLQIKPTIEHLIDREIQKAKEGKPCRLFFKTNSVTDTDLIEKIAEASQAGVPVTMLVRGICCLVPRVPGYTDNVRVFSIVGKLLEHSRIFCFGTDDDCKMYLSSADLMTRNMDKRVEIAWPIFNEEIRNRILDYLHTTMRDTAKLRELLPDGTYTPLGVFVELDPEGNPVPFDSQNYFIRDAYERQKTKAVRAAFVAANNTAEQTVSSGEPEALDQDPDTLQGKIDEAASYIQHVDAQEQAEVATAEPTLTEATELNDAHGATDDDMVAKADAPSETVDAMNETAVAQMEDAEVANEAAAVANDAAEAAPSDNQTASKTKTSGSTIEAIFEAAGQPLTKEPAAPAPEPVVNVQPEAPAQPKRKGFFARLFGR